MIREQGFIMPVPRRDKRKRGMDGEGEEEEEKEEETGQKGNYSGDVVNPALYKEQEAKGGAVATATAAAAAAKRHRTIA